MSSSALKTTAEALATGVSIGNDAGTLIVQAQTPAIERNTLEIINAAASLAATGAGSFSSNFGTVASYSLGGAASGAGIGLGMIEIAEAIAGNAPKDQNVSDYRIEKSLAAVGDFMSSIAGKLAFIPIPQARAIAFGLSAFFLALAYGSKWYGAPTRRGYWKRDDAAGYLVFRDANDAFGFRRTSWFEHVTPIALDLDGDGLETTKVRRSVFFDHNADGFSESTGWVGSDDGLLVWDRNGNRRIENGGELFGDNTLVDRIFKRPFSLSRTISLRRRVVNHTCGA